MAIMCEKLGVNVWEVINAASTKPFGFMKFNPGPGLGGHCIPIDPYYLSWKLKTLDYDARFIKLAGEINTNMPRHIIELISVSLNNEKKSINGSRILILGVAYKKDISDFREAPAVDIIKLLVDAGANVGYYDPYIPELKIGELNLKSLNKLDSKIVKSFDISVVITDHTNVDYQLILSESTLILDTRNVYSDVKTDSLKRLGEG